jgi:hypothetical protein
VRKRLFSSPTAILSGRTVLASRVFDLAVIAMILAVLV